MTRSTCVEALIVLALLVVCVSPNASAQHWASTATKAYPVQNLGNATLLGPLAGSTSLHVVLGLQAQNASQFQPTLLATLTPGNSLYGTSLTLQQFVTQFGATSAQVGAVENYLTSMGFTDITIADNQLLIDGYATAGDVESAFNTSLSNIRSTAPRCMSTRPPRRIPGPFRRCDCGIGTEQHCVAPPGHRAAESRPDDRAVHATGVPDAYLSNESYTPQQYQIAYDAACPSDNPSCPAKNFATTSNTPVGIIAEEVTTRRSDGFASVRDNIRSATGARYRGKRRRCEPGHERRRRVGSRFADLDGNRATGVASLFLCRHFSDRF